MTIQPQPQGRRIKLLRIIRGFSLVFILGLVLSGATAIPLETELEWLERWTGAGQLVSAASEGAAPRWATWLVSVREALRITNENYSFLAYGTDWLAFGHFVIAIAFIGLLRDPVRNRWLTEFGLIACALVVPFALIFGSVRGIPLVWRMIDCSFGVFGAIPLWYCRRAVDELERMQHWSRSS